MHDFWFSFLMQQMRIFFFPLLMKLLQLFSNQLVSENLYWKFLFAVLESKRGFLGSI